MNPFPQTLHFDNAGMIGGKRTIILTRNFPAITSLGLIIAPEGTRSDGASIPGIAKSIIGDSFAEYLEECVIHDHLYSAANTQFTRLQSDQILRELMWNSGLPLWKINSFYLAVRAGGWRHFKGTRK